MNTTTNIDLNTCVPGQKLRTREGQIFRFAGYTKDVMPSKDQDHYPFQVRQPNGALTGYTTDGRYFSCFKNYYHDIVEILPLENPTPPMNKSIQDQIAAERRTLEQVSERLRLLEQQAAQPTSVEKWEPKPGPWFIDNLFEGVCKTEPDAFWAKAGREYTTKEAAEAARQYIRFFARLCALAAELNPSGKPGGFYRCVRWETGWGSHAVSLNCRDPWDLFETAESAQAAAAIMNRDGWEVPAL